jgi:hypothetical protein
MAGQTIAGRVLSGQSGLPIRGVSVLLIDSLGVATRTTLSDALGLYALLAPLQGFYTVRVQRGNFTSLATEPFHLSVGQRIQVDLHVPPPVHSLPPITIVAPASIPWMGVLAGFHRRRSRRTVSYASGFVRWSDSTTHCNAPAPSAPARREND